VGWDQQSLAHSFNTMALHPPLSSVQDWVADSGATRHTTPLGNGYSLSVTSVGDSVLLGPFYLNNILLALDMVQSLIFVHHFSTDNWCSMEFDPFAFSVKDL
jgi:hypothetical protein